MTIGRLAPFAASRVTPGAGSAVMGTAVLSEAFGLLSLDVLSLVLVAVAGLLWLLLAALFGYRLVGDRSLWRAEAELPTSLTAVAATCVLGSRVTLLGWHVLAGALLALGAVVWLALLPAVLRYWSVPTVGASFLVCVCAESVAVLAATIALAAGVRWLVVAAAVAFLSGVLAYPFVLARFDFRQLRVGAGDHWVVGGALASASLACAKLVTAAGTTPVPVRRAVDLALWAGAMCWTVVLVAVELRWPRPGFDGRRGSTVFVLSMTAFASLWVGQVEGVGAIRVVGEVLIWPAFALCVLVGYGVGYRALGSGRVLTDDR
ncbi:MAG: hypothetical protein WCA46_29685 [Actinocatenispora sp.]